MKISMRLAVGVLGVLASGVANAWDGTDADTGNSVEIEQGYLVRSGETIDYIDHVSGETRQGDVEGITDSGGSVDVEITDSESGETRTLEMDPQ